MPVPRVVPSSVGVGCGEEEGVIRDETPSREYELEMSA